MDVLNKNPLRALSLFSVLFVEHLSQFRKMRSVGWKSNTVFKHRCWNMFNNSNIIQFNLHFFGKHMTYKKTRSTINLTKSQSQPLRNRFEPLGWRFYKSSTTPPQMPFTGRWFQPLCKNMISSVGIIRNPIYGKITNVWKPTRSYNPHSLTS